MGEQRYAQYCALARALDVVGNRWTLLIIRELRPGGRRFTDLVEGLPGISRMLLTERFRDLEREGILTRRELPPPAARQVYELTEEGCDLATAMAPMIAWGARRLGERRPGEFFSPRGPAVAMVGLADRDAAKGVRETYQYVVGAEAFFFVVDDGSIELHDGRADDAAVVVMTDADTWADLASGRIRTSSAVAAGAFTVAGDPQAWERLRKIFSRRHMLDSARAEAHVT